MPSCGQSGRQIPLWGPVTWALQAEEIASTQALRQEKGQPVVGMARGTICWSERNIPRMGRPGMRLE